MESNEVVGTPIEREIWLAPDWSKRGSTAAAAGPGATKVTTRTTTYRDGRVVTHVLDASHQPITSQVLDQSVDPDIKKAWDAQQDDARPPGGVTTKTVNGAVFQWNPVSRAYDIPTGQAPVTASTRPAIPPGGSSVIEGTPDPSKPDGWDNNRPRQVIKDKNDNVVWTEELTGADLTAWRTAQQANQPQSGEVRKDVPNRPGWTSITRTTKQGGNETTVTTFIGPDTNGQEVSSLPAESASDSKPVEGYPGWTTKVTKVGNDTKTVFINPQGQEAPDPRPGAVSRVEKPYQHDDGKTYTQVTETKDGATRTYYLDPATKQEVTLPPKGLAKLPPGAPELDLSSPEAAYSTTLRYHQWLDAKWRAGEMTAQQVKDAYEPAHTQAEMVINRAKDERQQQQQAITNAMTQRGQDIGVAGARLSSANSQFAEANRSAEAIGKLADPGLHATTNTRLGLLALQALNANAAGGMRDAPPVVVPGPVANLPQYPGTPSVAPGAATPATSAAGAAPPTLASPEGQGLMATNEANRQLYEATHGDGAPPGAAPAGPSPMAPTAVPGMPSSLGDTGAPPVSMGDPSFGMPTMALASSFSGGAHPYQGALDSLRAAGLDDETIQQALSYHVRGAA